MKILILYAVADERFDINTTSHELIHQQTGVGKVNAAIATYDAIVRHQPQLVLNIGTAGSVHHPVGSIHVCHTFVDRDMEKLKAFHIPSLISTKDNVLPMLQNWAFNATCNTGDTFLTDADGTGDVFEMEAFASASVCKHLNVPFAAIKYVTDVIGQNSVQHWKDKLADARHGLKLFADEAIHSIIEQ
jgi:adenosylhomocysteine nucleosidase